MGRKIREKRREVDEALLELCRAGILEPGYRDGEPTFAVTERFGERLALCHKVLMYLGRLEHDVRDLAVTLAVVDWLKPIGREEAYRYTRVLWSILRPQEEVR